LLKLLLKLTNRTDVTNNLLKNTEESIDVRKPDEAFDRIHTALNIHFESISNI